MSPAYRSSPALWALVTCLVLLRSGRAYEWSQENSCVLLNGCNTNPLVRPDECFTPENEIWCSCTKTVLTNPQRGEASGLELGTMWIIQNAGIGNYRMDVGSGTLDLSGLDVGNVIGRTETNELIPESAGVPPGTFFVVRSEVRVTATSADSVEFDVVVVEPTSPPRSPTEFVSLQILGYNPTDAAHSGGVFARGAISAQGEGNGFIMEYRYEGDEGRSPGIEVGDAATPGFTARFVFSLFTAGTDAASIYTLPSEGFDIGVDTVMRRFTEDTLDEILPLGTDDLCEMRILDVPCKEFEESLPIFGPGSNNPPLADVCVTDSLTLEPLATDVFIECGEGRALLRGSNSTDGDNGAQGLSYLWEVIDGEEGGAVIPEETKTFRDTEISFLIPDTYTIRLTVDDGQAEQNIDTEEVVIPVAEGFQPENLPPEIEALSADGIDLLALPEMTVTVELAGESVDVRFDSTLSTGLDGCLQELFIVWERVSGPADVVFDDPTDDDTLATFTAVGEYLIRLTLDDGAPEDNVTTAEITVIVTTAGNTFMRCDANGTGRFDIADPQFVLNFLFLGGPEPRCRETANCNSDGLVNIADGSYALNFLFVGGPPPAAPYPLCDTAPAEDCAESTTCTP